LRQGDFRSEWYPPGADCVSLYSVPKTLWSFRGIHRYSAIGLNDSRSRQHHLVLFCKSPAGILCNVWLLSFLGSFRQGLDCRCNGGVRHCYRNPVKTTHLCCQQGRLLPPLPGKLSPLTDTMELLGKPSKHGAWRSDNEPISRTIQRRDG
jgi:hypothetical protein